MMKKQTSRRLFLGMSGAGAAAVMLGTGAWQPRDAWAAPLSGYPFTLGVASGDPLPDGIVLWTRLAVDPLAPEGDGGMGRRRVPVRYQVAEDERFAKVVRTGVVVASPELGHSVHPEVSGLQPDREYFYRFSAAGEMSPVGRTRTAPAPHTTLAELKFAYASCQSYEGGLYTAYQHMAADDLDLVVHLGDYIYERSYVAEPKFHEGGALPDHLLTECFDLDRYRLQYSLYKLDQHLQAAHQQHPWAFTFDDHEVVNNWKGEVDTSEADRKRRAAGFQAMYENLPLRHTQRPDGPDIQIYRKLQYGTLANFTLLDSHQHRTTTGPDIRLDPTISNLGHTQRDWLIDELATSPTRWQIVGNQQPMAEVDRDPDPDVKKYYGSWDYFAYERNVLLQAVRDRGVENLVVVTGDRHTNYVCDLLTDYDNPEAAELVGAEFVGTSISSSGDGADIGPVGESQLETNPHMKFFNYQRGYSRVTVTPDTLTNDFRVLPYVSRPGADMHTRASFVVENGVPGAVEA
ncbi:alkaline phosphatase D family protein [Propionibacteriaceae bacterium Y2011]